ncbi:MAG: HEAT repeat domain-containing protein, partial [Acidobacteriota bacterium]
RIYRVMHDTTRRDPAPALSTATPSQLVETLSHPNGWRRDTAQRLLVERGGAGPITPQTGAAMSTARDSSGRSDFANAVVPPLLALARTATDPRTRLHALWTLDGIDAIDANTVTFALADPSRDVRASAIRIAERWLGEAGHPIQAAVLKRLDDPDWNVRQQLAASLGALPPGPREDAVVALLERYGDDPIVMDAALSGIRGSEAAVLDRLIRHTGRQTPRPAAGPRER